MPLFSTDQVLLESTGAAVPLPDPTLNDGKFRIVMNDSAAAISVTSIGATPFKENGVAVASISVPARGYKAIGSDGTNWLVFQPAAGNILSGAVDFFRSGSGANFPDGTTDTSENISRSGRVGVGISDPSTLHTTLQSGAGLAGTVTTINGAGAAPGTAIPESLTVNFGGAAASHVQLPDHTTMVGRFMTIRSGIAGGTTVNSFSGNTIFKNGAGTGIASFLLPQGVNANAIAFPNGWVISQDQRVFAGTGVTDANGNLTVNFTQPFTQTPIVSGQLQTGTANAIELRITALSTTSVTFQARSAAAVTILAISVLAASTPLAGATVHVIALEPSVF